MTAAATEAPAATVEPFQGHGTKPYRAYVLGALLAVYTFNFIDRTVISILQEPIKLEFGLSDFQLGLLGGPAFAVLYTFLGVPIARLSERRSRMSILVIALTVWSAMTALCGVAASYALLLLARVGVSVGEAGCTPPAQSVIADYFPANRRASAISIYTLGIPLGAMLAALGGGLLAQHLGWRAAFMAVGLPGLVLALIVRLTVREPPRTAPASETPKFGEALRILGKKASYRHVVIGSTIANFVGSGVGHYLNSFLMRRHELSLVQASQLTALISGFSSAVGIFLAGFVADRIARRYPNAIAWMPAAGLLISTPAYIVGYTSSNLWIAAPILMFAAMTHSSYLGSMYAVAHGVSPPRLRATAVALLLFIMNLIGYGLGPPAIGLLSDALANIVAASRDLDLTAAKAIGLQYAIVIGLLGYAWAAIHFLFAWRTLRRDWVG